MERPPSTRESEPKKFPTNKELREVFKKIVGGRVVSGHEPLTKDDEIKVLTVTVVNFDVSTEEYQYSRQEGFGTPVIMVTDIDITGKATDPEVFAEYIDGEWEMKDGVHRPPKT